jgi:hypothetical protein
MKHITGLLVFNLLLTLSVAAAAADLRVRVFERGGKAPLAGAAVCLGTAANLDQFGSSRTDNEGYVIFTDVPRASLLVTASMAGYQSGQERMITSTTNRLLVMTLTNGGGGPQCAPDDGAASADAGGLEIARFVLNGGAGVTAARSVTLDNRVAGQPTQYRASERRDFSGADWQTYATAPQFELSAGPERKTVYLQVRRHATVNGAILETLSPVVRASIVLQQP